MDRGKNSSKKNTRRQRRRQKAVSQVDGPSFNKLAHTPWKFAPFPRQMQFSAKYTQTAEVALSNLVQYNRIVGLFSFNNQLPLYALGMYDFYRYCRITGVHINLTVVPDGTTTGASVEMAMAKVPFNEATSPTPAFLQPIRGSKYKLVAGALGALARSISGSYASFDELGNPVYDRTFWQTEADAVSVTLDADEPVIAVAVRSVLGGTSIVGINLEITYHMEFFDLHFPDDVAITGGKRQEPGRSPLAQKVLGVSAHSVSRGRTADDSFMDAESRDDNRPLSKRR